MLPICRANIVWVPRDASASSAECNYRVAPPFCETVAGEGKSGMLVWFLLSATRFIVVLRVTALLCDSDCSFLNHKISRKSLLFLNFDFSAPIS